VGEVLKSGEDPSENRWRRLLSLIGIAVTLSAVTVELAGYLHFIRDANEWANSFINWFIVAIFGQELSVATLFFIKAAIIVTIVWLLFFIALQSYSTNYEHVTLDKWIEELCFLHVAPTDVGFTVAKTKGVLFLAVPVLTLFSAVARPYSA
jgi:hypothetical protein